MAEKGRNLLPDNNYFKLFPPLFGVDLQRNEDIVLVAGSSGQILTVGLKGQLEVVLSAGTRFRPCPKFHMGPRTSPNTLNKQHPNAAVLVCLTSGLSDGWDGHGAITRSLGWYHWCTRNTETFSTCWDS